MAMNLQFDRGDSKSPVGHALIYFRSPSGSLLATYVTIPPIEFDLSRYMPEIFANAMQGVDLGNQMVAAVPPIPEEMQSFEYLQALAARRQDDLVYAGLASAGDPIRLASETAEAASQYGDLYKAAGPDPVVTEPPSATAEAERYAGLSQQEQLNELSSLTGRLLDSLRFGTPDADIERQMLQLADVMPAKFRVDDLIRALQEPGVRGRKLAELYMERCYKLYNEDYLDLERIDREIEANHG